MTETSCITMRSVLYNLGRTVGDELDSRLTLNLLFPTADTLERKQIRSWNQQWKRRKFMTKLDKLLEKEGQSRPEETSLEKEGQEETHSQESEVERGEEDIKGGEEVEEMRDTGEGQTEWRDSQECDEVEVIHIRLDEGVVVLDIESDEEGDSQEMWEEEEEEVVDINTSKVVVETESEEEKGERDTEGARKEGTSQEGEEDSEESEKEEELGRFELAAETGLFSRVKRWYRGRKKKQIIEAITRSYMKEYAVQLGGQEIHSDTVTEYLQVPLACCSNSQSATSTVFSEKSRLTFNPLFYYR